MDESTGQNERSAGRLLGGQIELLGLIKQEVEALLARGGRVEDPVTDDLAGIVLVLRANLPTNGTRGHVRDELEGREREARELPSLALGHRR